MTNNAVLLDKGIKCLMGGIHCGGDALTLVGTRKVDCGGDLR